MSEWTSIPLEDLADDITVGFVGSMTREYVESGVPFLRSKNVEPYRINLDDLCYISSEFHQKIKKSALSPGDVVIVRTGKPGSAAIIPESFPVANCSDLVIVRPSSKLDRHFLVYYLNSIAVRHINSRLVGAVQQHFNIGAARELKIYCPPVEEQQEIASVLACLDRKIENLRRQNETLERIAQTLFKHWFVDFDFPNEDGKPYRSSGGEMVRSELGEIPAEWKVGKLGDIISAQKGLSYKGSGLADAEKGIPMHNLKSIYEGGGYQHEGIKFYKGEYKARHLCNAGDIIVCNTEQGEKHKLIAYPARIPRYFNGVSIYTHHISKLTPQDSSQFTREFIYYLIYSYEIRHQILTFTNGTTVNMLPVDGLEKPLLVVPPKQLVVAFSKVIQPMWNRAECNYEQIQTLTKTRDVLLPKLMSGKLRITE